MNFSYKVGMNKFRVLITLSVNLLIISLLIISLRYCWAGFISRTFQGDSQPLIIHKGNLTIADNEVYIIKNCNFQQIGSISVKDNATLVIKNSIFNQTHNDYLYIMVTDKARLIIENSSYVAFQNFEIKILLRGEAILNITNSELMNAYCGIWVWAEDHSKVYLTKTILYGYGTGGRLIIDHKSIADVRFSTLDYIVCWAYSSASVYESTVNEGVKAFSETKVNIANSYINYIWAVGRSKVEVQNTTVHSEALYEAALRASDHSQVSFFSSSLEDNLNAAGSARVKLKMSSVRNVSAYENAIVWLMNSTATKIYFEDHAKVYNFSSIQEAVSNAECGEYLLIPSGVYYEHVIINKRVFLVGESKETTIISGNGHGTVVNIETDGVYLSGFSIQNGSCAVSIESAVNCTITNNIIRDSEIGILLNMSRNCMVALNQIINNTKGMYFYNAVNCTVKWNNFNCNTVAAEMRNSSLNFIYQNNFINNSQQILIYSSSNNQFDNGLEGNYWDNYNGTDSNHDGIGDSPCMLTPPELRNFDSHPLMGPFYSLKTSAGYRIFVVSNSTIENLYYIRSNNTILILISNMTADQGYGFCRICIPHILMNLSEIAVIIDRGSTPVLYKNYSLFDNSTHRWIYFAYPYPVREIVIIPQFSSSTIVIAFAAMAFSIYFLKKRKCIRYS